MTHDHTAARTFSPGNILLSRTSKAEIGEKSSLFLKTETDYLTLNAGEAARLANFLRDQRQYPQYQERLDHLKAHILKGQATRGAAETILFELMVSFLPTSLLHQVQEIMTPLNAITEPELVNDPKCVALTHSW